MEIEDETQKQNKINELDKKFQESSKKMQEEKENESSININKEESNQKIKLPKNMQTINLIVLGMAGSGKTTFVQKIRRGNSKSRQRELYNKFRSSSYGHFIWAKFRYKRHS